MDRRTESLVHQTVVPPWIQGLRPAIHTKKPSATRLLPNQIGRPSQKQPRVQLVTITIPFKLFPPRCANGIELTESLLALHCPVGVIEKLCNVCPGEGKYASDTPSLFRTYITELLFRRHPHVTAMNCYVKQVDSPQYHWRHHPPCFFLYPSQDGNLLL